ncbi:MAG: RusA family crossover junction endodeoxyribonuclease [Nitrospira sp.]|nr:RusA family crossover junction endodeoxyribonuclease [Nitrospira sp.]
MSPSQTITHRSRRRLAATSTTRPSTQHPTVAVEFERSTSRTASGKTWHPPVVSSNGLTITLPIPPSINHQYATVNGRRVLSSAGRAYKTQVGHHVWLALVQSPFKVTLLDQLLSEPLVISINFFFASSLRRDLDGGLKITQDSVCEGLGINDNRIVETHLYKHVDKASPRIELSLSTRAPSPTLP